MIHLERGKGAEIGWRDLNWIGHIRSHGLEEVAKVKVTGRVLGHFFPDNRAPVAPLYAVRSVGFPTIQGKRHAGDLVRRYLVSLSDSGNNFIPEITLLTLVHSCHLSSLVITAIFSEFSPVDAGYAGAGGVASGRSQRSTLCALSSRVHLSVAPTLSGTDGASQISCRRRHSAAGE